MENIIRTQFVCHRWELVVLETIEQGINMVVVAGIGDSGTVMKAAAMPFNVNSMKELNDQALLTSFRNKYIGEDKVPVFGFPRKS